MQDNLNQGISSQVSDLKREIAKYARYWYLFLISVLVFIVLAQIKLRYTPKSYTTVSKIKILDKGKGLELPSAAFIFNRSNINLDNEIALLKSFDVLEKVVDKTDLTCRWYEEGAVMLTEITQLPFSVTYVIPNSQITYGSYTVRIQEKSIDILDADAQMLLQLPAFTTVGVDHDLPFDLHFSNPLNYMDYVGKTYILKTTPLKAAASDLKWQLQIEITGKSSDVLKLSLNAPNAQRSEAILDAIHEVFNEDGITDRQLVLKRTLDFIHNRFSILVSELDSIEINKKNFKVENKFISPEASLEMGMSTVIDSEAQIFELEGQILLVDFLKDQVLNEIRNISLLPASLGTEGISLNSLIGTYNTLILERDNLNISGGRNNPNNIRLESLLSESKKNLINSLDLTKSQLKMVLGTLRERDKTVNQELAQIPEKERLFRDIERQQQIKETLYLFLFQKREEAAINLAITEPSIKIIEQPLSSEIVAGLNTHNAIPVSVVIGLLIPFGFLYVRFLLDTKIHNKAHITHACPDIPIIGEIPLRKQNNELIFTDPNDHSPAAEAFRILGSNVNFMSPVKDNSEARVILATSTIKGEGKTYVSVNLSLALSSLNKRVLLIGADLRNPQIHTIIKARKDLHGLSNYLHDTDINWKDLLITGFERHHNHHILLSGSIPPNPAHLLTNGRFEHLIQEAKKEFDYIIIDSAPTILVTDTMIVSSFVDTTVYVVRANFTEKNLLNYSKELFETGKLNNMAYVLNGFNTSGSYGYGYNYGYNYGYGNTSTP